MASLTELIQYLEAFAPLALAESWDNVGLLVGNRPRAVARVMTCLTVTPASAAEAVAANVDLIVTHHPLPFRPLKRLTDETPEGRLLLELIEARIAVYSPHTAFDSTRSGINDQLARGLKIVDARPLLPAGTAATAESDVGAGRWGRLASGQTLAEVAARVKEFLRIELVQIVGSAQTPIEQLAIACGSAGEFLGPAHQAGCQALVTGETRFHTCLEAESEGVGLILAGHYASERFAVETLAGAIQTQFPGLDVWASRQERDPLAWI
jgi:dinuclear metal center YbgI/SA1388 family protein